LPLAKGELKLSDLIADSLLAPGADGIYALDFTKNLTDFNLSSLVKIPDTSIRQSFAFPLSGGPYQIPPGASILTLTQDEILRLNQVELRKIVGSGGQLQYTLRSYINGFLNFNYSIPGMSKDGNYFQVSAATEPGSPASPFVYQGTVDLAGYSIDLTGSTGYGFNKLTSNLNIATSLTSSGNTPVYGNDSVSVELRFIQPEISYARGYFGQQTYQFDESVSLNNGNTVPAGSIDLANAYCEMQLSNYVGADAIATLDPLISINTLNPSEVAMNFPPLQNDIQMTRAIDQQGQVIPTVLRYEMNATNSNITSFIGNLPDRIALSGSVTLNPLGDINAGNDFVYTNRTLDALLHLSIPLRLATNTLTLTDTIRFDQKEAALKGEGNLILKMWNKFPIGGRLRIALADGQYTEIEVIENNGTFNGSITESPAYSEIIIPVHKDQLSKFVRPNSLIIEALFITEEYPNKVTLNPDMTLKFQLSAAGKGEVGYE
jgi:hypothetical protein